jgi:hypothetical protein
MTCLIYACIQEIHLRLERKKIQYLKKMQFDN